MITLITVAIVHWQLLCSLEMMVDVVVVSSYVAGLVVYNIIDGDYSVLSIIYYYSIANQNSLTFS